MIDCISFYFYTASTLSLPPSLSAFPITLFLSPPLMLFFFFSPSSPVNPSLPLSPPPSPSVFPSYSNAKEGQWHPILCVFCFITTQVEQDILIYSNGQEVDESGQESVCASVCACVCVVIFMHGHANICAVTLACVLTVPQGVSYFNQV